MALAERARLVGELIAKAAPPRTSHPNDPDPNRRLRVGFVSADLRSHPIGRFLLGALRGFGPDSSLDFFAYANSAPEDDITDGLKAVIPNWLNVTKLTDAALDAQIVADKIDVLFDMAGHTGSNRLNVFSLEAGARGGELDRLFRQHGPSGDRLRARQRMGGAGARREPVGRADLAAARHLSVFYPALQCAAAQAAAGARATAM